MKNIIVAGAGHGGLTLACNLARNGYEVTVYEREKRRTVMGFVTLLRVWQKKGNGLVPLCLE